MKNQEPVTKRHLILALILFLFIVIGIPVIAMFINWLFPVETFIY